MGKHGRVKASTKGKRRQHHHHHPDPPAAVDVPREMEEALASPPSDASSDAAPQRTAAAAGDGRKVLGVKPASNGDHHPSPVLAEEVQHLRTLNGILAKQMVEARQERDQDQALLSEIEHATIGAALASQLSQEAGRLTRAAGERGRAEGADTAGREAARRMEERLAATESRWMHVLAEIEKKKSAACEESTRLKRDLKVLAQNKVEVEKKLRSAETETEATRGRLQDARKALERAQEENQMFKKDLQGLVLERDETRKHLDGQTEERNALEVKISDLEKRYEEARRALDLALSKCRALEEESREKQASMDLLTQEKASLEKNLAVLAETLRMVDDLRRQMKEAVLAKDEEVKKVVLERDEARQSLHLQMQGLKNLVARAREVAREVLGRALSQCQPPEVTAEEWGKDLELLMDEVASEESVLADALPLLNKLSGEMAKTIKAKGEDLEQTNAVTENMISMKEEECADLAKLNSSLSSELASLREEHESLKTEEEGLRTQVAELSASNGDAQKALEDLRVELKKQVDEKEENTRSHQVLVEGYIQKIEDLKRRMEAAAEEREEVEKEKGKQKDDIFGLQVTVAQLNSEIAALQELSSNRVQDNEMLRAEKDGVLERLGEQTLKVEALVLVLSQLEKSKSYIEQELGEQQTANAQLLEEKKQMDRQLSALGEEKASTQSSLAGAEQRLENTQKMVQALQKLAEEALSLMRSAAAEAARGLGAGMDGVAQGEGKTTAEEVGVLGDLRPFEVEMEAIGRALRRREAEVEEMRRELQRQQESVEGVQRANASWKWFSSAVAAISTTALAWAFAARGR